MEYKRIFRDGFHLLLGKVGTVVIGLANLMILTRILTTEQMGKYSLFLMIVNLAIILGLNWSNTSIVRHGREEFVKHKKINQSFWARTYLLLPMLVIFILLFTIFSKQIADYIGIEQKLIFFVIGMFTLSGLLNSLSSIYQSIDQMKKSAYVIFFQKLFYLSGLLLLFFNFFDDGLSLVLLLINISFLISLILTSIMFDFKVIMPYKFSKKYFRKIWSYSWPHLIGFSGLYIINYIDLYVIRRYLTLQDVGVYSVAYSGFAIVSSVILLVNTVFMPLIIEYKTKKRFDLIRKYFKKIPFFSLVWLVVIFVGVLLSNWAIPLLFSEKYVLAIPSFNVLLIGSLFYFISVCLFPIINSFDLVLYLQVFNIIKALINIVLDFMLVPKMGIIGAAYSTTIAFFIGSLLTVILIFIKKNSLLNKKSN